jgi:hypothetical protein
MRPVAGEVSMPMQMPSMQMLRPRQPGAPHSWVEAKRFDFLDTGVGQRSDARD